MTSILNRAAEYRVETDPFPHLLIPNALDQEVYEALVARYPPLDIVADGVRRIRSNSLYLMSAERAIEHPRIAKDWRDFFAYHVSNAFWREALPLIAESLYRIHPDLDRQLGRPLEDLTATMAGRARTGEVMLDCQFGINSPVRRESSVRTAHVDRPNKLFNALLYCRDPKDDTPGGALELYRFHGAPAFYNKRTAMPSRITVVKRIPYASNTLVLFLNSPVSVHGVTPRPRTPFTRRYINFLAEVPTRLFELPQMNPVARLTEQAAYRLKRSLTFQGSPAA